VFHFTGLSWRSMLPVTEPVTIFYPHLIAEKLTSSEEKQIKPAGSRSGGQQAGTQSVKNALEVSDIDRLDQMPVKPGFP
jgi:hypothetical protein